MPRWRYYLIRLFIPALVVLAACGYAWWAVAKYVPNPSDRLTADGIVVSVATTLVALITLFGVFRQIDLANQQLLLAREELDVVRRDLAYSEEQSRVNQQLTRKAVLSVVYDSGSDTLPYNYNSNSAQGQYAYANFLIINEGKTISPVLLNIYADTRYGPKGANNFDLVLQGERVMIDGAACFHYVREITQMVYEGYPYRVPGGLALTVSSALSFKIYWRIACADGIFPPTDYGVLHVVGTAY